MHAIMDGAWSAAQMAGFLVALRAKRETAEEIAGLASAMRARALSVALDGLDAIDTCGTGGDGAGTFNVSTAAALVAAGAGARVAKHGNRAISSRCGSADVLEALGVRIDVPAAVAARAVREAGFGFLFAPAHHAALRHAAGVRRELGVRTVLNVLGPLANPAGVRRQVVGVFDGGLTDMLARALGRLGAERALVVHGHGGLDEVSTTGPTRVASLRSGSVEAHEWHPREHFGLEPARAEDLR
ncbi:MAG TPA: anthranilate phosphoribosyltransferase, partial [Planctomycetota bacterium]|nr:anthranilate phosphoribosyltransferase [Planctomycetota bacterium]